jgi:hypothetical protein
MPNAAKRSNFIAASTNGATEAILAATARAAPSRRTPQTTSVTTAENDICLAERRLREGSMANAAQQMPEHVETAYKDAVDNIIFLKRQQWLATNYALLVYAAIFVISAHYFSRTDLARNWLGVLTIATFVIHWCMLHVFQSSIEKFRNRLGWIYRTYFSEDERVGLDLQLEPRSFWYQPELYIGLIAVSLVGAVLTAVYLWSVR